MSTTGSSGSYSTAIASIAAPRLLGVLGRDDRDRLADVPHAVDREHRLVGELEAVELRARHVRVGQDRVDAGDPERRVEVDPDIRACACGLRSVSPQSIPGAERSLAYSNSPGDLGHRVVARQPLADAADGERVRVVGDAHARSAASRTASKIFA